MSTGYPWLNIYTLTKDIHWKAKTSGDRFNQKATKLLEYLRFFPVFFEIL